MSQYSRGVRAKKNLGQHFLVDEKALHNIAAQVTPPETTPFYLEIGPGTGNLTEHILLNTGDSPVIALERDDRVIPVLRSRFSGSTLEVIEADALSFDLSSLPDGRGVAIGNLPYNVATGIFVRCLSAHSHFSTLVFMYQQEVAKRITAQPGTSAYGSLSVFAQLWGRHELLMTLPPEAFSPPPKVESGVVVSHVSSSPLFEVGSNPQAFEKFVKGAFQHRRKTIGKSLALAGWERKLIDRGLEACEFPKMVRAEALSPPELGQLWNKIQEPDLDVTR